MPTSKIQAEFLKSTKVDADEYKTRQDYLKAVMDKVNTFKDPQWDKMSEEAQLWMNDAIKAFKGKKRLPDFPDVGSVDGESEDDEDEAPKKKKAAKKPADDEDEEEAPKKKKKVEADDESEDDESEDEDEDEAPKKKKKPAADADEDEDEDEAPKKKKKRPEPEEEDDEDEAPKKKKKKVEADDEDEDEEEDEAPKKKKKATSDDDEDEAPKKKKVASVPQKASGVKVAIKDAIIEDPEISVDGICKKLGKGGAAVSKVTVSNIRAEFRHSLKHLQSNGLLKGLKI